MEAYQELEDLFAEYVGTKYAVACSSGTAALTLAVASLDIGEGDEVIVPEFTMVASAWAVSYNRATPVFVDCGDDLNIDPALIESKITRRTRAIMATHVYGRPADMERIREIADRHGLFVIEDACEAHGAHIGGKKVGSWGDVGCFSLYKNKIIQCEEGGMLTTDDERLANVARDLRSMAFGERHDFLHHRMGFNFRLTNTQARLAINEMKRIDEELNARKEWAGRLDVLGETTIPRPEGSVVWVYDILAYNERERDEKMAHYAKQGFQVRHFFKPMSQQPMYKGRYQDLKAYVYSKRGFYLAYPRGAEGGHRVPEEATA